MFFFSFILSIIKLIILLKGKKKYRIYQINENSNVRRRSISDNIFRILPIGIFEISNIIFFFESLGEKSFFLDSFITIKFKQYSTKENFSSFYSIFTFFVFVWQIIDPHYLSYFENRYQNDKDPFVNTKISIDLTKSTLHWN